MYYNKDDVQIGDGRLNFRFSVVMALYNTEQYFEEAIESIINQTIGFEDKIQVVLVNDGSTDSTSELCCRYRDMYPENIAYIKKKNGGVSSERNAGIPYIKGDYTIFFDGDDIWEKHAFSRIEKFFDAHKSEIDVCSCRMEYTGDYFGKEHPLNFKFKNGSRIIDLEEHPECVQSTIGNAVYKTSALAGRYFNENIKTGEDSFFNNSLLLKKRKIGLVKNAVFYYRRNFVNDSLSSLAPMQKSRYIETPKNFYLGLFDVSKKMTGKVETFIQYAVMYDIQWRGYKPSMMKIMSCEEKEEYVWLMKETLSYIDDIVIKKAKHINQYRKLYLYNLKYSCSVIQQCELKDWKLVFNDVNVISLRAKSMLRVMTMDFNENSIVLQGTCKLSVLPGKTELVVKDNENSYYPVVLMPYDKENEYGDVGEKVVEGERFFVELPLRIRAAYIFVTRYNGEEIELNPSFGKDIKLSRGEKKSYFTKGRYLVKYFGRSIRIYNNKKATHLASEFRYCREMMSKRGLKWIIKRSRENRMTHAYDSKKIKEQALFITVRSDKELTDNLQDVYECVNGEKASFCCMRIGEKPKKLYEAVKLMAQSKVIVTDDYLYPLRLFEKKPEQKIVQLWHACGAFKKFGIDGTNLFPSVDVLYHKDYDLVSVSSDEIRSIYATAFSIEEEKVKGYGSPRTDKFYDEEKKKERRDNVLKKHPKLAGKKIIAYAPTFRDVPGLKRSNFQPDIDFDRLSDVLGEDKYFVICPHPVMSEKILKKNYKNIVEIRDCLTMDVLFAADILITDYSSVIFEYALLEKPMAFYCYDFDEYERDFYLDYERELPGPLLKNQNELFEFIKRENFEQDDRIEAFRNKYMKNCDGKSSERIANVIERFMKE